MLEVEVKVGASHDAVRPRLEAVGAERLGTVRQVDTYYDAPHRDFATTDEALRIRRETTEAGEETAGVTYKGPLVDAESKTREEAETTVEDADAMAAVLDGLGFEPAAEVRKDRERYVVDDYVVTLDDVEGLGEFLEVEAMRGVETGTDDVTGAEDGGEPETGPEASLETAREGAFEVLARLGLDPDEQIRTSYLGLLLAGPSGDDSQ